MKITIENRPLTYYEKTKFHKNLVEVMNAYEYYTKRKFMRFDVVILDRLIKSSTPGQIIAIIKNCSTGRYSENFVFFGYIEPFIKNKYTGERGGKNRC